ncbi:A disintegrin and metalloproteinase with thrombospondin motifs 16-like [Uloborus diversus]|uniref:A disintegrin and metalloproteinase with thrombospondin motifs 16-like n=1 Tax=Uloborus diversus TaxID=327109 RepID=UPI00240A4D81|nr:A disintegrin and metalloproteinase with thrombospondin motifs 16-like [Uloborus diversus]
MDSRRQCSEASFKLPPIQELFTESERRVLLGSNNSALRKNKHWSVNNETDNSEEALVEVMAPEQRLQDTVTKKLTVTKATTLDRRRRATTGTAEANGKSVIETAVFIDQALYDQMRRTFPADTDRQLTTFVLTMMNAVQRLFQHSSLGKSPEIRLVLMETLKTQPQLKLYAIANKGSFKINMYVVDESGRRKRHVVGLAPVSGMCNPLNSCTISEGTSFQTVLVAAHEMGHSLGMEHDGHQDGNHCDSDTYVMSPTLGAGKTTWSSCSRQYLDKFLRSPQASCLQAASPYTTDLLEPAPEKLPGQVYDADYQCTLRYGEGSRRSALQSPEEICRMLRCNTGYGNKGVSFAAHPALEGTGCGREKWCQGGLCTPMQRLSGTLRGGPLDGGWGAWSTYSPCTSDCVSRGNNPAVGIMVSTRRCDNPRPQNGGRFCPGKDRRVLTCDATRICTLSTRKLILDEFISDTCRQASSRDNTLESTGTQFPSQENSHSCYVWCHKRGGGYMTQGWTIPDGTPCWRGHGNHNMYCVKGECQPFDCNGYSTESANDLRCSATLSGASALSPGPQSSMSEGGWGPWHKVSQCRPSCVLKGKGFQLVSRECNSVTGCPGQRDSFQLCDSSLSSCGTMKTVEQYSNEVCQRYRVKYPTVLSGKGRQLPPQPGFKNVTVLCQTGSTPVDEGFCAHLSKPGRTGVWPCNTQPCGGKWQQGRWETCSSTCGPGVQHRDVVCVQQRQHSGCLYGKVAGIETNPSGA